MYVDHVNPRSLTQCFMVNLHNREHSEDFVWTISTWCFPRLQAAVISCRSSLKIEILWLRCRLTFSRDRFSEFSQFALNAEVLGQQKFFLVRRQNEEQHCVMSIIWMDQTFSLLTSCTHSHTHKIMLWKEMGGTTTQWFLIPFLKVRIETTVHECVCLCATYSATATPLKGAAVQ